MGVPQIIHFIVGVSMNKNIYFRVPSGKRLHNYGKSPFFMGKSTINCHFQQLFVCLPEGISIKSPLKPMKTHENPLNHHFVCLLEPPSSPPVALVALVALVRQGWPSEARRRSSSSNCCRCCRARLLGKIP